MLSLDIGGRGFSASEQPLLIAGPCVLEDIDSALRIASWCADAAEKAGFFYVFKASYLKDNRSAADSYSGPGLEKGLEMLARVKKETGVPILTDVHCRSETGPAAEVCDVLQIPAFLARQTRLILGAAATGRTVNLKKGQFMSPEEMSNAAEKALKGGAGGVMITERGTFFGYNNLVVDMTSFARMRKIGVPLIFDATHSLQLPGVLGNRSGGRPAFARHLAAAAAAAGCDGLFIETHPEPLGCMCDAEVMLPMAELPALLEETSRIFEIVRNREEKG